MDVRGALKYFLIGTFFWVIVDFATTQGIVNPYQYYSVHFPAILIFYLGYLLVFSFLIYKFSLKGRALFVATVIAMLFVEVLFTHNAVIYSFPLLFIGIPVAIVIYSFLTYVPMWIVDGTVKKNSGKAIALLLLVFLISLLNVFGSSA